MRGIHTKDFELLKSDCILVQHGYVAISLNVDLLDIVTIYRLIANQVSVQKAKNKFIFYAKNSAELKKEINVLQKEVDAMQRRSDELSSLFKRLYEDNVLGRITNEQFRRLSSDYNAEQKALEDAIPAKLERLEKLRASAANVEAFIEKAKRFRTIDELTPELLRLFIQRIEIGERAKKYSHSAAQDIRIVYRDIGMVDSQMEEGEQPVHMTALPQNIDEMMKLLA